MKHLTTLILTLLVLGGCATYSYEEEGAENNFIPVYGFDNKYLVKFEQKFKQWGWLDEEEYQFLLLRSAEFASSKGFRFFEASNEYQNPDLIMRMDITLLEEDSPDGAAYEVDYLLSALEKKFEINGNSFTSIEEEKSLNSYIEKIHLAKEQVERKRDKEALERKKERERIALEKRKQQEFNRLYNTCLGFGFTEQNAIASCIQQEIFNEKKLLALKEQQIALEKQIALNSSQAENQEEESGFFLTVLEGVSESLADPQTWEIARNKAEIQRLKRSK